MTTKLIILLVLGLLVLGALVWLIVRAWRYRQAHPNEILWPYNGELNDGKESEQKQYQNHRNEA